MSYFEGTPSIYRNPENYPKGGYSFYDVHGNKLAGTSGGVRAEALNGEVWRVVEVEKNCLLRQGSALIDGTLIILRDWGF